MQLSRLQELVTYDPITGVLHHAKSSRRLIPDYTACVVVYDSLNKTKHKLKASNIAYELGNGKPIPKSHRVLQRNLKPSDTRLVNLLLVSRTVYSKIQESIRNLSSYLKVQPHSTDQYMFVVHYRENGAKRTEVKHDILAAKERVLQLQLKYAKLLNKYCIFD